VGRLVNVTLTEDGEDGRDGNDDNGDDNGDINEHRFAPPASANARWSMPLYNIAHRFNWTKLPTCGNIR